MGWSSWNTYRVNISDSLICKQADAIISTGLKDAGYTYINIDDGFFGGRDSNGHLKSHPERFPRGLKPVTDYIHSLGLKAGIYSDAGKNTCGHFWDNDTIASGVGFYGNDLTDADFYFNESGFDFIKIDFCGGDADQNTEHLELDERTRYTAIKHAIDSVCKKDIRINICRWAFPGTWVHSVGSSWRIAHDIQPNWHSIQRIIAANRYLSAYATGGKFNDMDMLEIGRGLTPAEERTHFGMWCLQSSPLLIGCDLTKIPPESLKLITNRDLIAINRDSLALQAYIVKVHDGVSLYVKDFNKRNGNTRVIGIYNPTDTARTFTFSMTEVDLGGCVQVFDLFEHTLLGNFTTMTIQVQPHDTKIYRLTGDYRLERKVYEAETAWLERFQNIGINPEMGFACYTDDSNCSAGAKVTHLGNHPDNKLEWRDIYSATGGKYVMTIISPQSTTPNSGTEVSVNGNCFTLTANRIQVTLKPGYNRISLSNDNNRIADIDCMTLEKEF